MFTGFVCYSSGIKTKPVPSPPPRRLNVTSTSLNLNNRCHQGKQNSPKYLHVQITALGQLNVQLKDDTKQWPLCHLIRAGITSTQAMEATASNNNNKKKKTFVKRLMQKPLSAYPWSWPWCPSTFLIDFRFSNEVPFVKWKWPCQLPFQLEMKFQACLNNSSRPCLKFIEQWSP